MEEKRQESVVDVLMAMKTDGAEYWGSRLEKAILHDALREKMLMQLSFSEMCDIIRNKFSAVGVPTKELGECIAVNYAVNELQPRHLSELKSVIVQNDGLRTENENLMKELAVKNKMLSVAEELVDICNKASCCGGNELILGAVQRFDELREQIIEDKE